MTLSHTCINKEYPIYNWPLKLDLSIQFSSVAQSCPTLCDPMDCSTPDIPVHRQLPELSRLSTWCHPTISSLIIPFSSCLQSFPVSGVFKWVSSSHQVAKVLEFQLQHHPFNEYSGLISFRMDWMDLLAVQGTLKSLLQHHSSKASILWCSAFFIVQLSHPYMTTGKTIALTRRNFVGKVMSLLFNTLSRLVITFLPRTKVSYNFMAAVTICSEFGAQKNSVCHCFHCFPIYLPWSDGTGCHDLRFLNIEF